MEQSGVSSVLVCMLHWKLFRHPPYLLIGYLETIPVYCTLSKIIFDNTSCFVLSKGTIFTNHVLRTFWQMRWTLEARTVDFSPHSRRSNNFKSLAACDYVPPYHLMWYSSPRRKNQVSNATSTLEACLLCISTARWKNGCLVLIH